MPRSTLSGRVILPEERDAPVSSTWPLTWFVLLYVVSFFQHVPQNPHTTASTQSDTNMDFHAAIYLHAYLKPKCFRKHKRHLMFIACFSSGIEKGINIK